MCGLESEWFCNEILILEAAVKMLNFQETGRGLVI
jgi:hypothetical protein